MEHLRANEPCDKFAGGKIVSVEAESPADDVGLYPGCRILEIDGEPIRDIIDWRWLSDTDSMEIKCVEPNGDETLTTLERDFGQSWGIEFEGLIFDGIKLCKNACKFCFMRQLPKDMRPSLSLRDDDFRLSFLTGTFVTLTNMPDEDIDRIIAQHISPLRVSLHAVDAEVRRTLIGKHHGRGIEVLEQLLSSRIEIHAQIVLVPGINDGEELRNTLKWAYEHDGIRDIGIVPLGFTRHQCTFSKSFDGPKDALDVLDIVDEINALAIGERGRSFAFAADEFYLSAYGHDVLSKLPDSSFYGDYPMFEDGIGIVRSSVEDMKESQALGDAKRCAQALADKVAHLICGYAMEPYIKEVIAQTDLQGKLIPLFVKNDFFGGNVNVTGLLCGQDIVSAIRATEGYRNSDTEYEAEESASEELCTGQKHIYLIPKVIFNDDGVTLDDMTAEQIKSSCGSEIYVVPNNPLDCIRLIPSLIKE